MEAGTGGQWVGLVIAAVLYGGDCCMVLFAAKLAAKSRFSAFIA